MSKPIAYVTRLGAPAQITGVRINMFHPDETRRKSVVEVTDRAIGEVCPKPNSIRDRRLGTVDRRAPCDTCGKGLMECSGHMGHHELHTYVYYTGHIDRVARIMRCVCFHCAALLVSRSDPKMKALSKKLHGKDRFNAILLFFKSNCKRKCLSCGLLQPKRYVVVKKDRVLAINPEWEQRHLAHPDEMHAAAAPFSAHEALKILTAISDEDSRALGFSEDAHPERLIMSVMPVAPPSITPSILEHVGAKKRGADDLTNKSRSIIKDVHKLRMLKERGASAPNAPEPARKRRKVEKAGGVESAPSDPIKEAEITLQYDIQTYLHNDVRGMKQSVRKSGIPTESIFLRLKGKEGRIRGTMMGKRVDYTARSVITPDPDIDVNEYSIPHSTAEVLTYTEDVTYFNVNRLRRCVESGPGGFCGAQWTISDQGVMQYLDPRDVVSRQHTAALLGPGWKVARHMQDADPIVVGRQPSLHKMSMMGHSARVFYKRNMYVAGINPVVTTPYNADFDGDEMNSGAPQSITARAEAADIMSVRQNIISPQNQKPVMGLVQDGVVGSVLLTHKDTFFTKEQLMLLLCAAHHGHKRIPHPAVLRPRPLWTGKQLYSTIIPQGINISAAVRDGKSSQPFADADDDAEEKCVLIRDGDLLAGTLCKSMIGCASNGITEHAWRQHGPKRAQDFLSDAQRLVNQYMVSRGLSAGIDDAIIQGSVKARIEECKQIINAASLRVREMVPAPDESAMLLPHLTEDERACCEAYVHKACDAYFDTLGRATQNRCKMGENAIHAMVKSKSKGNAWNNTQMEASVGAQIVAGGRIYCPFDGRALPSAPIDDQLRQDLKDVGMVFEAYRDGLTPQAAFLHAAASRESLVDSQANTPDTGYIQRRLEKFCESHRVWWNGMVTDGKGCVVQYKYGGDGMDPVRLQRVKCSALLMSNHQLEQRVLGVEDGGRELGALIRARDKVRAAMENVLQADMSTRTTFNVPSNPKVIVDSLLRSGVVMGAPVSAPVARARVEGLCKNIPNAQQELVLRSVLTSRNIAHRWKLDDATLTRVLETLQREYDTARANNGDMVGAIAAQSIGEPATQITLNTFHHAGRGAANLTLGVPRLKEVIDNTVKIKGPSATVFLKPPFCHTENGALQVASTLEFVSLGSIVHHAYVETIENTAASAPIPQGDGGSNGEEMDVNAIVFRRMNEIFGAEENERFGREQEQAKKKLDGRKQKRNAPPTETPSPPLLHDAPESARKKTQSKSPLMVCSPFATNIVFVLSPTLLEQHALGMETVVKKLREHTGAHHRVFQSGDYEVTVQIRTIMADLLDKVRSEERLSFIQDGVGVKAQAMLGKSVWLKGISPKITKARPCQRVWSAFDRDTGEHIQRKEWIVVTDGTDLSALFAHPFVDATRTYSNHPHEIGVVLGLDPSVTIATNEVQNVVCCDGTYVNPRHFSIPVDTMATRGTLAALSRHGISRISSGFLLRASFEKTVMMLYEAAAFGERDSTLNGITESVMVGTEVPVGTGTCDVLALCQS